MEGIILANYFNLTLDTTAPPNPTFTIENGAGSTSQQMVTCQIGGSGAYQMKIWGTGVDGANDPAVQTTEAASSWVTFATSKQVKLSSGDGVKSLNVRLRDDVYNESGSTPASITLDMTVPTVNISTLPDVTKISTVSGKDACHFSFTVDSNFVEYKVMVVTSNAAAQDQGTVIGTANGSQYMSGTGSFLSSNAINCTITGLDLKAASAGDETKVIKVFAKDANGNWSV